MVWAGDNYPQEYIDPREENGPADECSRPEGHEYERLTRHPDPPGYEGALSNAICMHCSDQAWIAIDDEDDEWDGDD